MCIYIYVYFSVCVLLSPPQSVLDEIVLYWVHNRFTATCSPVSNKLMQNWNHHLVWPCGCLVNLFDGMTAVVWEAEVNMDWLVVVIVCCFLSEKFGVRSWSKHGLIGCGHCVLFFVREVCSIICPKQVSVIFLPSTLRSHVCNVVKLQLWSFHWQ